MMKNFLLLLTFVLSSLAYSQDITEWNGNKRSGYFHEKNLAEKWPQEGPKLLWTFDGIGDGYGAPIVSNTAIYVNGDVDSMATLFAFNLKGKLLWKTSYGKDWTKNYPGSRSAPTLFEKHLYAFSGTGILACFDAENGKIIWQTDIIKEFEGIPTPFGYSESPAVDNEKVYISTGSNKNAVVAFNRLNGDKIWTSTLKLDTVSYTSPLLINFGKSQTIVNYDFRRIYSLNTETGAELWTVMQDSACTVHGNTPIFENGTLYHVTGCGNGAEKIEVSNNGNSAKSIWKNSEIDNVMGGFVKSGDFIYTTSHRKRKLISLDTRTGQTADSLKFGRGSIILADSKLFCYAESGQFGLIGIDSNSGKMNLVSSFKINFGTKEHFAHPFIKEGILYVRHGNSLAAYDIRK